MSVAFILAGAALAIVHGSLGVIAALAFACAIGAFVVRQARIGVVAAGHTLLIRNVMWSRRIDRAAIDHFRLGASFASLVFYPRWPAIQVVTKTGESMSLDVTIRPLFVRSQRQVDETLTQLNAWLTER
ncbi:MAG: hypothetical protein ACREN2_11780 [Candidatus Dormibacteria bacterium]